MTGRFDGEPCDAEEATLIVELGAALDSRPGQDVLERLAGDAGGVCPLSAPDGPEPFKIERLTRVGLVRLDQ